MECRQEALESSVLIIFYTQCNGAISSPQYDMLFFGWFTVKQLRFYH